MTYTKAMKELSSVDWREILRDEIGDYFESTLDSIENDEDPSDPLPWMHYIFQDAGISLVDIGGYQDDPDFSLSRSYQKATFEQIDNGSVDQIAFYMGARGQGMEWI